MITLLYWFHDFTVTYICNFVSSIDWQIRFVKTCSWCITASSIWNRPNMTVMLVILWVLALLRCALGWWWHDVHKLIFLRQASCSMYGGSVGYGLGWVGSMKIDPWTTLWRTPADAIRRLDLCMTSSGNDDRHRLLMSVTQYADQITYRMAIY